MLHPKYVVPPQHYPMATDRVQESSSTRYQNRIHDQEDDYNIGQQPPRRSNKRTSVVEEERRKIFFSKGEHSKRDGEKFNWISQTMVNLSSVHHHRPPVAAVKALSQASEGIW